MEVAINLIQSIRKIPPHVSELKFDCHWSLPKTPGQASGNIYVISKHRRMGTLWLGGAEGLICPKFYTDNSFLKGGGVKTFHKHPPPLGHCLRDVTRPPENWKTPPLLDIHKHPPLDIVRVTSSALRKIEKHHHSWTFARTPPPLDIACVTSSTFQGGATGLPSLLIW